MQCLKIKEEWPKFKKWWTSCELNTKPNRSLPIWGRKVNPTGSAKNQDVQLKTLGNIELYELGEMSTTIECRACLKCAPEGLIYCSCGVCFMPSPEQRKRITIQFEVVSVPYYIVRVDYSRGAKHCESQWQHDHWKARAAKRGATRKKHDAIELRWKNDDKYRAFHTFHGWTKEYCLYLDYLTTFGISAIIRKQPCAGRERRPASRSQAAHKLAARAFAALQREQGVVPYIPKGLRERQLPSDEQLRSDLEWQSWNWKVNWSQASSTS